MSFTKWRQKRRLTKNLARRVGPVRTGYAENELSRGKGVISRLTGYVETGEPITRQFSPSIDAQKRIGAHSSALKGKVTNRNSRPVHGELVWTGSLTSHILALVVLPKHAALKVTPRIGAKSGAPGVPRRSRGVAAPFRLKIEGFFSCFSQSKPRNQSFHWLHFLENEPESLYWLVTKIVTSQYTGLTLSLGD